jgi:uncharacterized protein (DUF1697 family)
MKHYCFIKAINVGGKNSVAMADLVRVLKIETGGEIASLVNSGNLIIDSELPRDALKEKIQGVLKTEFGIDTSAFVLSRDEIATLLEELPYAGEEADKSRQLVYFMLEPDEDAGMESIAKNKGIVESCYLKKGFLFVYYKNGVGRSKLTTNCIDKAFKTKSTGRNIGTIEKIMDK